MVSQLFFPSKTFIPRREVPKHLPTGSTHTASSYRNSLLGYKYKLHIWYLVNEGILLEIPIIVTVGTKKMLIITYFRFIKIDTFRFICQGFSNYLSFLDFTTVKLYLIKCQVLHEAATKAGNIFIISKIY